jgi:predicted nucleic acid-binding Zn ribbon protein
LSEPHLHIHQPLRYVIHCSGCGEEIEICPDELDDRLAVCPSCNQPNRTPIHALLSGRRHRPKPE